MCCCMPSTLSYLRRVFPQVFGSTSHTADYKGRSYNFGKSPLPSNAIQKSVTHTVSYMPRAGDSDVVELMDIEENKPAKYNQW